MPNQAKGGELSRLAKFAKAIYLSAAAIGGLYVAASVVWSLWLQQPGEPPQGQAPPPDVDVLECQRRVADLLDELGDKAVELIVLRNGKRGVISTQWAQFTATWTEELRAVGWRCRFADHAGGALGVHYDRIARVYEQLPSTHLRYDNLVRRFDNQQAGDLIDMRRALERSRMALERREN